MSAQAEELSPNDTATLHAELVKARDEDRAYPYWVRAGDVSVEVRDRIDLYAAIKGFELMMRYEVGRH